MLKRVLEIKGAPDAKGPYSTAVAYGDLIFISGQGPIDPLSGKVVEGNVVVQANQVFSNLRTILDNAGSGMDCVLKVVVYLIDLNDFEVVNDLYKKAFEKDYPARTCIQAAKLPLGIRVEIDVITCKRINELKRG